MGLIGIHCPYKRKDISMQDCLECARTQQNPCGYPAEVVEGIKFFNESENRKDMVSATAILGCMRSIYLGQTNDYYAPLDSLYWSFRGQLGHLLCEKFKQGGAITEKRFRRTVGKIKISGKMDVIYPDLKLIRDFKTTKAVPRKDTPYENHILQTNIYKWILAKPDNEEPIEIDKLKVTYFDMKETKTVDCPLMEEAEIEKKVLANGAILQNAFDTGEIPEVKEDYPTDWQCNGYCPVAGMCSKIWKAGQKV